MFRKPRLRPLSGSRTNGNEGQTREHYRHLGEYLLEGLRGHARRTNLAGSLATGFDERLLAALIWHQALRKMRALRLRSSNQCARETPRKWLFVHACNL